MMTAPALSSNLNAALVVAVEISRTAWVIAAHAPGLGHIKIKQRIEPRGELWTIASAARRSPAAGSTPRCATASRSRRSRTARCWPIRSAAGSE